MSSRPLLAPDAAIVLGIASTAMPFARTPEAEVERWLRLLRLHGQVGSALQALGVSEGALAEPAVSPTPASTAAVRPPAPAERDVVERVIEQAVRAAGERGAAMVATTDVLIAVMRIYGEDFDRALRAHGSDRDELLEKLSAVR
jgi:hypothetical protein